MAEEQNELRVVVIGAGMAGILSAIKLREAGYDFVVYEKADRLGGNHTWSFHAGDLSDAQHAWMAPLVEYAWGGYEVRFPGLTRRIGSGYYSFTASRLHDVR